MGWGGGERKTKEQTDKPVDAVSTTCKEAGRQRNGEGECENTAGVPLVL